MTRPSLTEQLIYGGPHPRIGFVNLGCPKALVDSERNPRPAPDRGL
jgi:hypothetical protein